VVHSDARRFTAKMAGQVIRASSPQGRFTAGAAKLDGRVLCAAEAYGKNLFLRFCVSSGAGGAAGDTAATLHVHLDDTNCMEMTALRGDASEVRHFADHIIAERGVRYGRVVVIPTAPEKKPREPVAK